MQPSSVRLAAGQTEPSYSIGKRVNYHEGCKNLSGLFRIN